MKLTGETDQSYLQLRTKDHADHVGHSQLLVHLRVSSDNKDKKLNYLNKNLLTVLVEIMETKDVTVDGWTKPSNTL
jgi:hypothetical protein